MFFFTKEENNDIYSLREKTITPFYEMFCNEITEIINFFYLFLLRELSFSRHPINNIMKPYVKN